MTNEPATKPVLYQHTRGWGAQCPDCTWDSGTLPFPNPDAALHCLTLHQVLCKGGK